MGYGQLLACATVLQPVPISCHFRGCKVPLSSIVSGAISSELALPFTSKRPSVTFPTTGHHRLLDSIKLHCLLVRACACVTDWLECTAVSSQTHSLLITVWHPGLGGGLHTEMVIHPSTNFVFNI